MESLSDIAVPHSLFSLRFFVPGCDERGRLHRQIGFSVRGRVPAPIWFLVQFYLALKWRWKLSSAATERALDRFGKLVEAVEGIPIATQRKAVLSLSRRYCIPPHQIFRFGLIKKPDRALDYLYPREIKPLHQMKNGGYEGVDQTALQDKFLFSCRAKHAGLSSVPTIQVLQRQTFTDLSKISISTDQSRFLKSRSGFRGIGAFVLHKHGDTLNGQLLSGEFLESDRTISESLSELQSTDDVLVQPFLTDHPVLAGLSSNNQSVVLRTVTMQTSSGERLVGSYLRVPVLVNWDDDGHKLLRKIDVLMEVDPSTGQISPNRGSSHRLHPFTRLIEDRVLSSLSSETKVPYWTKIADGSLLAQREFSRLWAVAWDWIITEEQPFLLEGNVYWGMQKLQEVVGGMVPLVIESEP